ncbi:MAG: hypothetical protein IJC67_05540, partial [Clostridia bacterium]|nr:hypothetical protein [Clostridia bacterium]
HGRQPMQGVIYDAHVVINHEWKHFVAEMGTPFPRGKYSLAQQVCKVRFAAYTPPLTIKSV